MNKLKVAFLCTHNSCRSQMAEAITKLKYPDSIEPYSAGTTLKDRINPDAVRLVKERYKIDMEDEQKPKLLYDIPPVDIVITMGCGVVCPLLPYDYYEEDWGLDDPAGQPDEEYYKVMDTIEGKLVGLAGRYEEYIKNKNNV